MIERLVFEPGASAVHSRGGGGDDVDDGWLGRHQTRTIGSRPLWILRHQGIWITLLSQQNGDDTGPHDDTATANRNEQVRPCSTRCGSALFHSRPGRVFIHAIKDTGIERAQLVLD